MTTLASEIARLIEGVDKLEQAGEEVDHWAVRDALALIEEWHVEGGPNTTEAPRYILDQLEDHLEAVGLPPLTGIAREH